MKKVNEIMGNGLSMIRPSVPKRIKKMLREASLEAYRIDPNKNVSSYYDIFMQRYLKNHFKKAFDDDKPIEV